LKHANRGVTVTLKKLETVTAWQPFCIYIQLYILQTSWQHYADQKECMFVAQGAKLNDTGNGEDYSLM
jgi:hypothetical protein